MRFFGASVSDSRPGTQSPQSRLGRGPCSNVRDRDLEGIVRVAVFPVQGPGNLLVKGLQGGLGGLGDVAHDGVHGLALVVALFALDDILGRDTALGKINVTYEKKNHGSVKLRHST